MCHLQKVSTTVGYRETLQTLPPTRTGDRLNKHDPDYEETDDDEEDFVVEEVDEERQQ